MDPRKFDEIARRLAQALPRRAIIEGSVGAWVLAAFQPEHDAPMFAKGKRSRKARVEACTRNGKKCGRGKKLKPCSKCCSGFTITTRSKKNKCACRPDGTRCTQDAQCCAGVCFDRFCGALS